MTVEIVARLFFVFLLFMLVIGAWNFLDSTKSPSVPGDRAYIPFHRDGLEGSYVPVRRNDFGGMR